MLTIKIDGYVSEISDDKNNKVIFLTSDYLDKVIKMFEDTLSYNTNTNTNIILEPKENENAQQEKQ